MFQDRENTIKNVGEHIKVQDMSPKKSLGSKSLFFSSKDPNINLQYWAHKDMHSDPIPPKFKKLFPEILGTAPSFWKQGASNILK